ncbi:MAG: hypothetical protein ACK56F_33080 [bacterium]
MAPPVNASQVGQTQERNQGSQRAESGRVGRHPHLALRQVGLCLLVGELEPRQPVLQVLPRVYAVL